MAENYFALFWSIKAKKVFSSKVATVIGPTQPGEGVIKSTKSTTFSKSTSQQKVPFSSKFEPTSIITELGEIISRVKNFGLPIATIIISEFLVISDKFGVLELQIVTVAQELIIIKAIGLPTILERPRIATFLPSREILYLSRSVIIPFGVQDHSHFLFKKTLPIWALENPSTSFS